VAPTIVDATGTITYGAQRLGFDVTSARQGRNGQIAGAILLHPDRREASLRPDADARPFAMALAPRETPPILSWNDQDLR
jgi:hypothetical protein